MLRHTSRNSCVEVGILGSRYEIDLQQGIVGDNYNARYQRVG